MNYAGAGLIVLSPDCSSILLVHDARSGKWGFPKGHRESDDTSDLDTAIRECREETGLTSDDYLVNPGVFKISKGSQSYLFRYAIMKDDGGCWRYKLRSGPSYEIADLRWVPVRALLDATQVLDGNKYLRTWISDIQSNISKKSVYLFRTIATRLLPAQEPVGPSNIIACA